MKENQVGVISHWYQLFEDFNTSALDFYTAVEEAVKRRDLPDVSVSRVLWKEGGIGSAEREYLRVGRERLAFDICAAPYGESFFFSWWLSKLPPRYGILAVIGILLVCLITLGVAVQVVLGAFGTTCMGVVLLGALAISGFPGTLFLMGWAVREGELADEDWVLSLPVLGPLYGWAFNPLTYYRMDIALMFQESVRSAVMEVIEDLRSQKGLRALSAEEWEPRLRNLAR